MEVSCPVGTPLARGGLPWCLWWRPDGRHFLFLALAKVRLSYAWMMEVHRIDEGLGAIRSNAVHASGHLLFVDQGLMAQRFDLSSRQLIGAPFRLSVSD